MEYRFTIAADDLFNDDASPDNCSRVDTTTPDYGVTYDKIMSFVGKVFPEGRNIRYLVYIGHTDIKTGKPVVDAHGEFEHEPPPKTLEALCEHMGFQFPKEG